MALPDSRSFAERIHCFLLYLYTVEESLKQTTMEK